MTSGDAADPHVPQVNVADEMPALCDQAAGEVLRALADAQSRRGSASVVLTGGRTGTEVLVRMRDHEARWAGGLVPG